MNLNLEYLVEKQYQGANKMMLELKRRQEAHLSEIGSAILDAMREPRVGHEFNRIKNIKAKKMITKVKILTTKSNYKELETEVNAFLATKDNDDILGMVWNDTDTVASVFITYLEDEQDVEKVTLTLKANTEKQLGEMLDTQIRDANHGVQVRRYRDGSMFCCEITKVV